MNDKDEHTVTISFVDGYTVYAFRCNAGPESLCHAVYTCDCDEYYDSCIRNGVPAHRPSPFDMDTWHAGVFSAGECSHKDWFDNADDVPLDGEMTFSVNPVWHGGYETFDITTSRPTAEVKAEALEDVVRQAMEQRAGGLVPLDGRTWGEPDGYWITMHAPIVAEAIATHLRENGGA